MGALAHAAHAHLAAVPSCSTPTAGAERGLRHGASDPPVPGLLDHPHHAVRVPTQLRRQPTQARTTDHRHRSEEHTSELQSLMRISYAGFCLKKNKHKTNTKERNLNNEFVIN